MALLGCWVLLPTMTAKRCACARICMELEREGRLYFCVLILLASRVSFLPEVREFISRSLKCPGLASAVAIHANAKSTEYSSRVGATAVGSRDGDTRPEVSPSLAIRSIIVSAALLSHTHPCVWINELNFWILAHRLHERERPGGPTRATVR